MATVGNDRKFYFCSASGSNVSYDWLAGEQSNSFNRSAEAIEVTDKSTKWAQFLSGKKSATGDVTVILDDTASTKQRAMLDAFSDGDKVTCFVGVLGAGSTPSEGDVFDAIITACNDTNNQGEVASRSFSLQVTGAPTHYPVA